MTRTIQLDKAYASRPFSPERYAESLRIVALTHQDEAERRRVDHKLAELERKARRYQSNADEQDARWYVTRQDPLSTFERQHRQAGLLLRLHRQTGLVILGTSRDFTGEHVDGGQPSGMEEHVDRRRQGERAWTIAIDAIDTRRERGEITLDRTDDYKLAVERVIIGRWSLGKGAERIGYPHRSGQGRSEMKRATEQALDAASAFLGIGA